MQYFGNVARNFDHPGRQLIFKRGQWELNDPGLRRVGRPRANWANEIMKHVNVMTYDLNTAVVDRNYWRKIVNDYCNNFT